MKEIKEAIKVIETIMDDSDGEFYANTTKTALAWLKVGEWIGTLNEDTESVRIEDILAKYQEFKTPLYHDITCNCYDCREGKSLKAKD